MLKTTRFGEVIRFDLARTLGGRGHYWTTCYLLDDLLVDTGCAHAAPELVAALVDTPVRTIVTTHSHEDHIGANGQLQGGSDGLRILAHPMAVPVLADPRSRQPLHPYRRLMWGWPLPSQARELADGEVVRAGPYRLQVLYTPGHSPDHICLWEAERGFLFTGDLYVGGADRALRAGYDVWQIIASLKRLAVLPAKVLFPGAAKVRDNPAEVLASKIEHLERLGEKVLALDRKGKSVARIASALCGPPMFIELLTLGHFSRRHLVRSYLGRNHDAGDVRWRAAGGE